jgi:hypothetical protein
MSYLDKDSFDYRAVGEQYDGMKPSAPRYSFGKGTRDQLDKVFLSHTAEKTKGNKDTPGAIYDVPSDLGRAQSFTFSKAPQRVHMKQKYPDSSIDLIETIVDSGYVKFDNQPAFYFGTEAKDCMKNSAITRNHQSASMGVIGPGPAGYLPDAKSHLEGQPTYPFGVKTKFGSMFAYQGSTPLQVGPGKYKLQKATGKQSLSTRATLPAWGFGKGKRFPTSEPDLTIIDPSPNRKAMGKQVLSRSRSAPIFGFGTATRDHRAKTGCYILPEDKGPANDMGETHQPHPKLQMHKTVVKYSPPGMSVQGFN